MAAPYYLMPDGTFPLQSGSPVLIDQTAFEDCCCDSWCRISKLYLCVGTGTTYAMHPVNNCLTYGSPKVISKAAGLYYAIRWGDACWFNGNNKYSAKICTSSSYP